MPPPKDFKGKKVVLVAGVKSHGPGDHEFFAGTAILCGLLKQNGVWPVMVRDGWPTKPETLRGARSVVFFHDGVAQLDELEPRYRPGSAFGPPLEARVGALVGEARITPDIEDVLDAALGS